MSWRSLRPESIDLFFQVNTLKNMLDQEFSVNYESQNMVGENLMGILSGAGESDIEIEMDDEGYSLSYIEIENANLIYDY